MIELKLKLSQLELNREKNQADLNTKRNLKSELAASLIAAQKASDPDLIKQRDD